MLLSVAVPSFPGFETFLNFAIGLLPADVKSLLPAEFFSPGQLPSSSFIYQALPGETNDVRISGVLANSLLMLNESPAVAVLHVAPAISPEQLADLRIEHGLSLTGQVGFAGELGVGVEAAIKASAYLELHVGLEETSHLPDVIAFLQHTLTLPDCTVMVPNIESLASMITGLDDALDALTTALNLNDSQSGAGPKISYSPATKLRNRINALMPPWARGLIDQIASVVRWTGLDTAGIYLSAMDGNDRIDLSELTGVPQNIHGGSGDDVILGGGSQHVLSTWGYSFYNLAEAKVIQLYGEEGRDTFVINPNFDALDYRVDGGTGSDRLLIEGTDHSEIIRLIAGPGGKLAEIRFEGANVNAGLLANEVQTVQLPNDVVGGSFTLSFEGLGQTAPIAWNADGPAVEAALEALGMAGGDVAATGNSGGPWTVTFGGSLANTDVPLLRANGLALQRKGVSLSASTIQEADLGAGEIQRLALSASAVGGSFRLRLDDSHNWTDPIFYDATGQQVQDALLASAPELTADDIQVVGFSPAWYVQFGGSLAGEDRPLLQTDEAGLSAGLTVTAVETTPADASTNQVQTVTMDEQAVAGTFRLGLRSGLDVEWTALIGYDASAGDVQAALEALSDIGAGNVAVSGPAGGPWDVEFIGDLAATSLPILLGDGSGLRSSTEAMLTVEEFSPAGAVNEIQRIDPGLDVCGGTFTLSFEGMTTAPIPYDADGAAVQAALEAAGLAPGDVSVTGEAAGPWDIEFTGSRSGADQGEVTVDGAELVHIGGANVQVTEDVKGNDGADTVVLHRTVLTELIDVERLDILGNGGDDTVIIDNSLGPIHFDEGIYLDGGEGYDRIALEGSSSKPALSSEHRAGRSIVSFGISPDDVQQVLHSSEVVCDFLPAGALRLLGGAEDDTIQISAGEYNGAPTGLARVSGGASWLYFTGKQELVIRAGGGDDAILLDAADLPAGLGSITVDGESSVGGDALMITGTNQDDLFDYTPTSAKGGVLALNAGGRVMAISLAGIESFGIDALQHDALGDGLIVRAAAAAAIPGDFPGTGEVTAVSAAGLPRLAVEYLDVEDVNVQVLSVLILEGGAGDDTVEVAASQVSFIDSFGHRNVTNVGGAEIVCLQLMDGNDEVAVLAPAGLPFQLEVLGGGSDPNGDALSFAGSGGQVKLDLADDSLADAGGSHLTFSGMETFDIDTAGGPLAVSTAEEDETLQITPFTADAGQLALGGSALTVAYAGVAGQAVALDLAGGQDTLVVNGSSVADAAVLDAEGVAFTDDGRRLTYAGVEALVFNALQGDDQLDVDNSAGLVALPGGVCYDGGPGLDLLRLLGSTEVDCATYDGGPGVGAGWIVHALGAQQQVVLFANLEPVIDIVAGPLVVNGTPASNAINYDIGPNSGQAIVAGLSSMRISVDSFEPLEFGAKTALTINGLAGHDSIDLNNAVNPPELAALTADGGSGDDLLIGSAGDDVLIGGRGDDVLRGEDGDDLLIPGEGQDSVDGGSGDDTAAFTGTAGKDAAAVSAAEVLLNGAANSIVNVETVSLETLAGDDEVFVEAGAGFPGRLEVAAGAGDDDIFVLLANRAPSTVIAIDGGPHAAGDTATVKGMTGDDEFSAYGAVSSFGAAVVSLTNVEDFAVVEGRRIDCNRASLESSRFIFGDADGNVATVRIAGPGTVDVFRNIVNGRDADIYSLELAGTDELRTRVSVGVRKAPGTDNETSIGLVSGSGVQSIFAPRSDLVREGLDLAGGLGKLTVDDIRDGADLLIGGESGRRLTVTADEVGTVDLRTGRRIERLKVSSWAGGTVEGSTLDSVVASHGPFGADLLNTRRTKTEYGIRDVSIRGDLTTNISADRVRSIKVINGDARVNVTVSSDAATLFGRTAVGSFSVKGGDVLGADFELHPGTLLARFDVRAVRGVGGNVVGAVNVSGDLGDTFIAGDLQTSGWIVSGSMGDFVVVGVAEAAGASAAVRAGGDMGAIVLGAVRHVDFLAGVSAVGRHATSSGEFNGSTIGSVRVTGAKMAKGAPIPRFVEDSYFSAAAIGQVKMVNADFGSSGLYLDEDPTRIGWLVHRDTEDDQLSFVWPSRKGAFLPPGFVNVL